MKRDSLFWGGLLIILGVLFFLQAQGLITGGIFKWFWAIFLIAMGAWIVIGVYSPKPTSSDDVFNIPHQSAKTAKVTLEHGAGYVVIHGGASGDHFLVGTSAAMVEYSHKLKGDQLNVNISAGPSFVPFMGPNSGAWEFKFNPTIPMTLDIEAGATNIELDLQDLLVTNLKLETGASATKLTVPARGASFVDISAGAASINIIIPSNVAARIQMDKGFASLDLDKTRFIEVNNDLYKSADFDTSQNRTEINIEAGLASIRVA